jgi:hypothetical protein
VNVATVEKGDAGRADAPPVAVGLAVALGLILVANLFVILVGMNQVLQDKLPGPDSYMRLLRVTQLYETGAWYDGTIPRSNAPYGEVQHWTRPSDLLLLGGALALEPILGFQRALFWWGAALAPLLHLAMILAMVWAVVPFLDRHRRFVLILVLLTQIPVWPHGLLGKTDHHMLIMLTFAIALGGAFRVLSGRASAGTAWAAGAAAGLGLWLSIEMLVVLGAIFGALSLAWLRGGGSRARWNLWHALGLASTVALAFALEHPPEAWSSDEYDRISVVHLFMAVLAAGFWGLVVGVERLAAIQPNIGGRVAGGLLGALAAGGAMALAFPKFFLGPEVDFDPALRPIFLDVIIETQPLIPDSLRGLCELLLYLGPAVAVLPWLGVHLWQDRRAATWNAWLLVGLGLLAYLPLAVAMQRFSVYACLFLAIGLADLAGRLMERARSTDSAEPGAGSGAGRLVMLGLALPTLLIGHIMLGAWLMKASSVEGGAVESGTGACHIDPLVAELKRLDGPDGRPLTVLAHRDHGAALLYRTRHSVVSTPYPRNAQGQLDAFRIYSATDFEEARQLIENRRIDLIVACVQRPIYGPESAEPDMLESHLRRGQAPDWLTELSLGEEAAERFRLYRVEPERN